MAESMDDMVNWRIREGTEQDVNIILKDYKQKKVKKMTTKPTKKKDYFKGLKCDYCGATAVAESGVFFSAKDGERNVRICEDDMNGEYVGLLSHSGNPICPTVGDYIIFCKKERRKSKSRRLDCSRPYIKEMK